MSLSQLGFLSVTKVSKCGQALSCCHRTKATITIVVIGSTMLNAASFLNWIVKLSNPGVVRPTQMKAAVATAPSTLVTRCGANLSSEKTASSCLASNLPAAGGTTAKTNIK